MVNGWGSAANIYGAPSVPRGIKKAASHRTDRYTLGAPSQTRTAWNHLIVATLNRWDFVSHAVGKKTQHVRWSVMEVKSNPGIRNPNWWDFSGFGDPVKSTQYSIDDSDFFLVGFTRKHDRTKPRFCFRIIVFCMRSNIFISGSLHTCLHFG